MRTFAQRAGAVGGDMPAVEDDRRVAAETLRFRPATKALLWIGTIAGSWALVAGICTVIVSAL